MDFHRASADLVCDGDTAPYKDSALAELEAVELFSLEDGFGVAIDIGGTLFDDSLDDAAPHRLSTLDKL